MAPVNAVTPFLPTLPQLPATPLPHNPYMHLLTPTAGSQSQPPNYHYYYNSTPPSQFPVSVQHVSPHTGNIASSSRTPLPFPLLNYQFRPYNPKNLK